MNMVAPPVARTSETSHGIESDWMRPPDVSRGLRATPRDWTFERYHALVQLSEVLGTYYDRDTLVRALPQELRPVLDARFLGLRLYDEQLNILGKPFLDGTPEPHVPPEFDVDDALANWVIHEQRPLIVPILSERRGSRE